MAKLRAFRVNNSNIYEVIKDKRRTRKEMALRKLHKMPVKKLIQFILM